MEDSLTERQKELLALLRSNDLDTALSAFVKPVISPAIYNDIVRFKKFLADHGHPNPQPADLYLTVERATFLSFLRYANNRNCLVLQCCFGFNRPPLIEIVEPNDVPPTRPIRRLREVGQVRLIQKGNFHQIDGRPDADFFDRDTVFKNDSGDHELFMNMDPNQPLPPEVADQYIKNFRAMYSPERTPENDSYTFGYVLPVKALLLILSNPRHPLGTTNRLTFRWGLSDVATPNSLGNFSLVIGTDDLFADPVIEFRRQPMSPLTGNDPPLVDCPPNRGCP